MATKRHGYGTIVQYDLDDVSTYTSLTDAAKVKIPKQMREKTGISYLESPNMAREYLAGVNCGWIDTEEMIFDGWFTNTQFNTLVGFMSAGTEYYWKVLLPLITGETNKAEFKFRGYVASWDVAEIDQGANEPIRAAFAIQRTTGLIAFTAAS